MSIPAFPYRPRVGVDGMDTYVPKVGDHIGARRKSSLVGQPNLVVGPVVETGADYCRVRTNRGTEVEGNFLLPHGEWSFQFIYGPDGLGV